MIRVEDSSIIFFERFWIEWFIPIMYDGFIQWGKIKALGPSKRGKYGCAWNRMCYTFSIGPVGFRYYADIKRKKKRGK